MIFWCFSVRAVNFRGSFICDKCGAKFSTRESLQMHINFHQKATMFCDHCPQPFNDKRLLVKHILQHHLRPRKFECSVCSYKAFYDHGLKVHMMRHGPKAECKICHKFVTNMKDHLKSHIKEKCPICSKIYSKNDLSRHMKTHRNRKEKKTTHHESQSSL